MKLVSLLMSLFIGFQFFPTMINESPLVQMADVAVDQEIEVTSWKVYIKAENKSVSTQAEIKKELSKLMDKYDTYYWNKEEYADHSRYIAEKKNMVGTEHVIVTVYEVGRGYKVSVSLELTGEELTRKTIDFIQNTYNKELEKKEVYYSVYGSKEYTRTLKAENEVKEILHALSAKPVEEMTEKGFHSVSALHKEWGATIPTNNGEVFNLQVGVRVNEKERKLNIAIGTPIITSGY